MPANMHIPFTKGLCPFFVSIVPPLTQEVKKSVLTGRCAREHVPCNLSEATMSRVGHTNGAYEALNGLGLLLFPLPFR